MFVDTHCHIHEASYADSELAYRRAIDSGVTKILCVGTDETTSIEAMNFANEHDRCWYSIGVHPHDTSNGYEGVLVQAERPNDKLVAIGEIGLDYFYTHSPRETQISALEAQLDLAVRYDLPVIFHVREAFDDFWPIYANFSKLRGVLHSYTDTRENMEKAVSEGLYIGMNGISTFTKDATQREMFSAVPLERMLLETDSPFLTPVPNRGKINEPAFVRHVAEFHANAREVDLEHLARVTSANASTLFSI